MPDIIILLISVDLYMYDPHAPDGLGRAVWSTHQTDGFFVPATHPGPEHYTLRVDIIKVLKVFI